MREFVDVYPSEPVQIDGEPASFRRIARACAEQTPERGFSIDEMHARFRVIDALDHPTNGVIELEDNDAKKLLECIDEMRWGVLCRGIVEFVESMRESLGKRKPGPIT